MAKTLTTEARARIAAFQKARWAKASKKKTPAAPVTKQATAGVHSSRNGSKVNGNGAKVEKLNAAATLNAGTLMQLDAKTCRRSPWNRDEFDDQELKKLIADVKEHGVNQNGIVRKNPGVEVWVNPDGRFIVRSCGGGMHIRDFEFDRRGAEKFAAELNVPPWEVIAGERRWTAALKTGRPFPAVERKATDVEALELQATENMLREDLNPMDEATKFEQLRAAYIAEGLTRMEALERIEENTGKAESTILERLTLVTLPEAVQKMIRKGALHASHAGLMTKLRDPAAIEKLANEMKKNEHGESMSFRDAKKRVDYALQVEKNLADWQKRKAEFEGKGQTVIPPDQCAKLFWCHEGSSHWGIESRAGYVNADKMCDLPGAHYKHYDKLWRKAPAPHLGRLPDGRAIIVYLEGEANEAVKAGGKLSKPGTSTRPDSEVRAEREKKAHRQEFMTVVPGVVDYASRAAESLDFWKMFSQAVKSHSGSDAIKLVAKRRWLAKGADAHGELETRMESMNAMELRGLCTELLMASNWPHTYSGGWGSMIREAARLSGQELSKWGKSQTSGDESTEEEEDGEDE